MRADELTLQPLNRMNKKINEVARFVGFLILLRLMSMI